MNVLGSGLSDANYDEEAMSVKEAELSMLLRLGASESSILATQTNLANTYLELGRLEDAVRMSQHVYSGRLKLDGEENDRTLRAANNYASSLGNLKRFEEARVVLRKTMPVARRVLGEENRLTLKTRTLYALALYDDPSATLDDLHEAVTTLEETGRIARRVLGGSNPTTTTIQENLQGARATLRARETPSPGSA